MPTIKPGTPIVLDVTLGSSHKTDKRDATAEIILDLWPAEKQAIAKRADGSRTHVDNVLETYFNPLVMDEGLYAVDPSKSALDELLEHIEQTHRHENADETVTAPAGNVPIDVLLNNDEQYISGYLDGYVAAYEALTGEEMDTDDLGTE